MGSKIPIAHSHLLIDAFEAVAGKDRRTRAAEEASLSELVHAVFEAGHVYAWEILRT